MSMCPLPLRDGCDILRAMDVVLTPEETAAQLGLETADTVQLFESGRLSGFRLGDEWRVTPAALRSDLERIRSQIAPPAPPALGPRSESAFRIPPPLRFAPPRLPERRDYSDVFKVRIIVENNADYEGEFALYLTTEGSNDRWEVEHAHLCERVDSEMLIRDTLVRGEKIMLFTGSLCGHVGDRLFLSVPVQAAVSEETDRAFVLQADLALRVTLINRGILGRRRSVKIKEVSAAEVPSSE